MNRSSFIPAQNQEAAGSTNATKLLGLLGDAATALLIIMLRYAQRANTGHHSPAESATAIRENLTVALDCSRLEATVS